MAMVQEREWAEAQKIDLSVDLVEATKKHLKFLAAVDRNRFLYEDHALERAIYRYNAFWLPLLAKHLENPLSEGPLVVPLDCEWIWHCHRLSPIIYKFDCEKLFGRILGNQKVLSSVEVTSKNTTEEIWKKMYPEEPYELDLSRPFSGAGMQKGSQIEKFTNYDLVSAVKRQITFTFQVSRPHVSDELFLQEAMARYKGFLHLIRTNVKLGRKHFCVPTYDIDLMWHTHQLYPDSYCKDTIEVVGFVVHHDDTDSDRSKGSKLDVGHSSTISQWEQTFGFGYWKAGAMYRGSSPTPVTQVPYDFKVKGKEFKSFEKCDLQIQFPTVKAVEVLFDFVDIKNLPEEHKENIVVAFSKKQPDKFFNTKRLLGISSNSKEKLCAIFNCEPTGEFLFELVSYSPVSNELKPKESRKLLGSCSLSFEELFTSQSQLSTDKWLSIDIVSGLRNSGPVLLHISMSFTRPALAPQLFQLVRSPPLKNDQMQTHVMDDNGKKIFSLQSRNIIKDATKCSSDDLLTEVYCVTDFGEKHALVENHGTYWSVKGTHGSFKLQKSSGTDDSLFELVGHKTVKLFPGRRLDFQPKHNKNITLEQDVMTAVEFSTDYPYGRAVALINSKIGTIKATEEWIVLPSIALAFIQSFNLRGRGPIDLTTESRNKDSIDTYGEDIDMSELTHEVKIDLYGSLCGGNCGGVCGYGSCRGRVEANAGTGLKNSAQGSLCGGNCGGVCGYGSCRGRVEANAGTGPKNSAQGSLCGGNCGGVCGYGSCRGRVEANAGTEPKNSAQGSLCGGNCGGVCGYGSCRGRVEANAGTGPKNSAQGSLCGGNCGGVCGYGSCRGRVEANARTELKNITQGSLCGGECGSGSCRGGRCWEVVTNVCVFGANDGTRLKNGAQGSLCTGYCGGACRVAESRGGVEASLKA